LLSTITYFTGGASYSVPTELIFTYVLTQLRFLFFGFVIVYYFQVPYTVIIMALSVLLADYRFFIDFTDYMNLMTEDDTEEDL
jgi:hypothetical protein